MKTFKKVIQTIILTVVATALVACGGTTTTGDKKLNLVVDNAPSSLNSLTTSLTDNARIVQNLGEGLVRVNAEDTIEPGIASEWDVSEDGSKYTFHLRNAYWQNGDQVTAQDFEFAWKKVATLPTAEQKSQIYYLKNGRNVVKNGADVSTLGVKAIDTKTLEVELESPITYILDILAAYTFYPVQEKFYNEVGGDDEYGTSVETIMSNGAYTLETYNPDAGYTFKKNINYWDKSNISIEEIEIKVVNMIDTQAIMFEQGEIDIFVIKDSVADKYATHKDLQLVKSNGMEYIFLSGNTATPAPLLNNKNFKAAVAHAIDKETIANDILKNGSMAADYMIPQSFVSLDGKDFREVSGKFNKPSFNVTKAQEYLAKAKAEIGDLPLEFTLVFPDTPTQKKVLENLKSQIETNLPGVTVNIETVPTQLFYPTLDELATPAARSAWSPSIKDPTTFLKLFLSDNFLNSGQYKNAEYDEIINNIDSVEMFKDPEARWDNMIKAEEILLNDYTIIPLYQSGAKWLVNPQLKGATYSTGAGHNHYRLYKL